MLETVTNWFAEGGTYLTVGLGSLVGGAYALQKVVSTFNSLKELLPQKVQSAVDGRIDDLNTKIESVKTSSDSFKLQETIINCKAKLESSVLSDEVKAEYKELMINAQTELKDVYGIVKEINV